MKRDRAKIWARHIEDFKQSGLSQAAFCRERGLTPSAFHRWKARLTQQAQESNAPSLVEVTSVQSAAQSPSVPSLRLEVSSRYTLELAEGFDEALLLKTLKVLERL